MKIKLSGRRLVGLGHKPSKLAIPGSNPGDRTNKHNCSFIFTQKNYEDSGSIYRAQNGSSSSAVWCSTHFSQSLCLLHSFLGQGQLGADITKNII